VASLEAEVSPAWPYRLPRRGGGDSVTRVRHGVVTRFMHCDGAPVVVRAWQRRDSTVVLRAEPADPDAGDVTRECLELAVERMRFALGVDDDYGEFYDEFRSDRLVGRAVSRKPWVRPRRRPWPWEALAWAVTEQLIDVPRAAAIQRRIVHRWGPRLDWGRTRLRDVPSAELIAGRAPAELAGMDLAPKRALALVKAAREAASGRADLSDPDSDARLLAISNIGPWTVQCLGLFGRGDPDSLPAGDLAYVKLIGHLRGLGRRATVEEVEDYFEPYRPFRGLAGTFMLSGYHSLVAQGPPLRLAA
jgi:3-methyladenine DNA glycosylase/8-oxoguanine DNA glycosylase